MGAVPAGQSRRRCCDGLGPRRGFFAANSCAVAEKTRFESDNFSALCETHSSLRLHLSCGARHSLVKRSRKRRNAGASTSGSNAPQRDLHAEAG